MNGHVVTEEKMGFVYDIFRTVIEDELGAFRTEAENGRLTGRFTLEFVLGHINLVVHIESEENRASLSTPCNPESDQ